MYPNPVELSGDTSLDQEQALAWVEETFGNRPSFRKREDADGDFVKQTMTWTTTPDESSWIKCWPSLLVQSVRSDS